MSCTYNFISTCGEREREESSIDTLAYVFLGNHLDAAMFPRNGLLISRFRSCLDDMCAIIYANQSCSADPFYIARGYEGGGGGGRTLVSAKSARGEGEFVGSIGRGGGRQGWKIGLDQSGANEEVNGLQASYVSLYTPCTRRCTCVVPSRMTASPR